MVLLVSLVVLFCFVLFCFVLFCFVLFCFALLCFALLCFALLCFALLCFVLLCFTSLLLCFVVCVLFCLVFVSLDSVFVSLFVSSLSLHPVSYLLSLPILSCLVSASTYLILSLIIMYLSWVYMSFDSLSACHMPAPLFSCHWQRQDKTRCLILTLTPIPNPNPKATIRWKPWSLCRVSSQWWWWFFLEKVEAPVSPLPPRAWHNVLTLQRLFPTRSFSLWKKCFFFKHFIAVGYCSSNSNPQAWKHGHKSSSIAWTCPFYFFSHSGEAFVWKQGVFLIANVASECGYTASGSSDQRETRESWERCFCLCPTIYFQFLAGYDDLVALDRRYRDKGLQVIGVPCNQFGQQEPGELLYCVCNIHGVTHGCACLCCTRWSTWHLVICSGKGGDFHHAWCFFYPPPLSPERNNISCSPIRVICTPLSVLPVPMQRKLKLTGNMRILCTHF